VADSAGGEKFVDGFFAALIPDLVEPAMDERVGID
jgi:hypothetical protein